MRFSCFKYWSNCVKYCFRVEVCKLRPEVWHAVEAFFSVSIVGLGVSGQFSTASKPSSCTSFDFLAEAAAPPPTASAQFGVAAADALGAGGGSVAASAQFGVAAADALGAWGGGAAASSAQAQFGVGVAAADTLGTVGCREAEGAADEAADAAFRRRVG